MFGPVLLGRLHVAEKAEIAAAEKVENVEAEVVKPPGRWRRWRCFQPLGANEYGLSRRCFLNSVE